MDKSKEKYFSNVFDEYVSQLETIMSETPVMGSFFEDDLVLFCLKKDYFSAYTENLNISTDMEKFLNKKYVQGLELNNNGKYFELRKSNGPHSEYPIYFFSEK